MLISKREGVGLKRYNGFKAFIEHLNNMEHTYENNEEYSTNKKRKILIMFDDIIEDCLVLRYRYK